MNTTHTAPATFSAARIYRLIGLTLMAGLLSACGEINDYDGDVVEPVDLALLDNVLTLHCEDAGIAGEPCVLDDPDNPYALTAVTDENKFDLSTAAPTAKARFYLWATAQALSPRGENQFYTAEALHELFSETGSELAREQALRGYRSVLDNYFYSVTFFVADFLPPGAPETVFPFPVRKLVGQRMASPSAPLDPLFDFPIQANETFGEWGYTYDDQGTQDFTPNF